MIQGTTRQERIDYQLEEWGKGNSIHNDVDDECCPDFSCCNKDVVTEQNEKDQFIRMTKAGHDVMGLLGTFLGRAMDAYYARKGKKNDVYICDGINEQDN